MSRWLTQTEQPTLDEILDEPIIGLVMASDGVTRADIRAIVANLPGMRPDVGDRIIYRLSVAPPTEVDDNTRTDRRDPGASAQTKSTDLSMSASATRPGLRAR